MIMLSIVLSTPSNAASIVFPCLILAIRVPSKIGGLKERSYKRRIYIQVLKTPKEKMVEVREFLRAKDGMPHVLVAGFTVVLINYSVYGIKAQTPHILLSHSAKFYHECVASRAWHRSAWTTA
jgi:hypothetical protein